MFSIISERLQFALNAIGKTLGAEKNKGWSIDPRALAAINAGVAGPVMQRNAHIDLGAR